MLKFNKELLKGSTSLLVLKLLSVKDMYGYELMKTVKTNTNGAIELKEGSIYPMLQILEADDFILSYWEETNSERKRKYYHLTEKGALQLKKLTDEWNLYTQSINSVLQA